MSIGCAVLAAGASRRLGQPKQLVVVEGQPLIQRVVALAHNAGSEHIAVVVGYEAERVTEALQGAACEVLDNPAWAEGVAASIRAAARWADERGHAALMLLVSDQLRLTAAHLAALWAAWRVAPDAPVASVYLGTLGVPAVFPRAFYSELAQLHGDRGASRLLRTAAERVTQIAWPDGEHELDTPEDLSKLAT
jgi:molybdenum cofactor cytidylyltransferase